MKVQGFSLIKANYKVFDKLSHVCPIFRIPLIINYETFDF